MTVGGESLKQAATQVDLAESDMGPAGSSSFENNAKNADSADGESLGASPYAPPLTGGSHGVNGAISPRGEAASSGQGTATSAIASPSEDTAELKGGAARLKESAEKGTAEQKADSQPTRGKTPTDRDVSEDEDASKPESALEKPPEKSPPPENGEYEYIDSKSKRNVVNFKNGELNGPIHIFDTNNVLEFEGNMTKGKLHGLCRSYKNGVLVSEAEMLEDVPHGLSRQFDEAGGGLISETWFDHGVKQGEMRQYHSTGEVASLTLFEADKMSGPASFFDTGGARSMEAHYRADKLHGKSTAYYSVAEGGRVMRISNYVEGQLDGVVKSYSSSGEATAEDHYKRGQLVKQG
ncbi:MAG: hypothetical protein LBQ43_05060 [Holosporales bacterium]|jgi:antitoxin component YwqK of YwqJK toxin-antitoxin module|nr:hypothetical protein [Holosporales bacterium]